MMKDAGFDPVTGDKITPAKNAEGKRANKPMSIEESETDKLKKRSLWEDVENIIHTINWYKNDSIVEPKF